MNPRLNQLLDELARRAGLRSVPPAAVAGGVAVLVVVLGWALWRWWPAETVSPPAPLVTEMDSSANVGSANESAAAEAPQHLLVHVVGAVRHPGVYELNSGARVSDAVDAAGGALADAVQAGVNMARPVSDGEQIVVPDEDDDPISLPPAAASAGAGIPGAVIGGGAVNINTADVALLDTLPGVGPSTAQKILADRETNGPFRSVDDLGRVSGIGPKRLEQLRELVAVQ